MDTSNHLNNTAIDLSFRSAAEAEVNSPKTDNVPLVRPIPRLPWTITWYQSVWSNNYIRGNSADLSGRFRHAHIYNLDEDDTHLSKSHSGTISPGQFEDFAQRTNVEKSESDSIDKNNACSPTLLAAVLDVACCDGPVAFERVLNPNFALTVEHNESTVGGECHSKPLERRQLAIKTYLCIYCNQSFKSLFCYQKHKKRHLNPVSVDITATHNNAPSRVHSEDKTKDLNVQFFPCKKCGSKFPSYYFVHKHRKVCHAFEAT